jgi:hypothetical protein
VIISDGTIVSDGVIASDGTIVSDSILFSLGLTMSDGSLVFYWERSLATACSSPTAQLSVMA